MNAPKDHLAQDHFVICPDGQEVGPFSSHWAAVAAMIRISNPDFISLGGDKPGDIALELAKLRNSAN